MNNSEKENNTQACLLDDKMKFEDCDSIAFQKAYAEKAASIVASRNVKIFMKLEDPQSTYELFEKSVEEALPNSTTIEENKN